MGTFHAVWVPSRNHEKNKTVLSDHKHLIKLSGTVFGHLFIENLGTNFYISFGLIHLVRTQLLAPDTLIYVCVSGCENISFSENFAYVLNEWLLLRCREDAEFRIYCTRRDLFRTLSNIHDDIFCENSDQKPLTIFLKGSIIDMWKGYVSDTMYSFSEIFEDIEENCAIK